MKQFKAKITENKKVAEGFYKMRLDAPYIARSANPGQFIEVKCSNGNEHLLRRPFSVHRILRNEIEILYQVVGSSTELLSYRNKHEYLDIIGPLGNGFTLAPGYRPLAPILIAGGIGVAPLLALAEKLTQKKTAPYIIIGARTKNNVLCEKEFKRLGCFVMVSTEDGSKGHNGYATDILGHLLKTISCRSSAIYACGPHPMLKAVSHITKLMKIPCQVSLEERMACGVGVCLGCPVKIKGPGYKMVCKDGPVFDAKEIAW